jgi:predicted ferric reductase
LRHWRITMKSNEDIIPIRFCKRILLGAAIVMVVIACIGGALSLPFLYESQTLYYKFGMDKVLLRSAKMVGLAVAILLLLQLPLAGRLQWLDRIFSLPGLYRIHRLNAYLIGALIASHPFLVLAPEGRWKIPFELRSWPEWVGVTLLTTILAQIGLSRWRSLIFHAYQKWRLLHYTLGILIFTLLITHILFVSETFNRAGLPRNLVFGAAIGSFVLWLWIRQCRLRREKNQFKVNRVEPAGINGYRVDLEPKVRPPFSYMPGQFVFVSFESASISREFHPFTLSSTPSRPGMVQFIIRSCGDWTNRIGSLHKGDRAYIQGPFGRFSHLLLPANRELVMIAGGIGITPMLSMLRYMSDRGDSRRITLIWSNRTRADLFGDQELTAMREKLTNFFWVPILTRETGNEGRLGRLDRNTLEKLLRACSRDAAFFLCGPPPMVKQAQKDLLRIGFAVKAIHTEAFGF